MIEDFAKRIPGPLMNEPGNVFGSGRRAFATPSGLYFIGDHPGGSPEALTETIENHSRRVFDEKPDWSAYRDESWGGSPPGGRPMQRRMQYLFKRIEGRFGLSAGEIPASNLIFKRWDRSGEPAAKVRKELASLCWPFHEHVIENLNVRVVVCLRIGFLSKWVSSKLAARPTGAKFTENNRRQWTSVTYKNADGLYVVAVSYPGVADWESPNTDPTGLVLDALETVHGS